MMTVVMAAGCGSSADTTSTKQEKTKTEKSEKTDLTKIDLNTIVGKSEKAVRKLGFKKNKEDGKYYYDDICVGLNDDGQVNYIVIKGDADKTPSFRKAEIGMNIDTAMNVLQGAWDQEENADESYTVISYNAKEKIVFEKADDKITSICYSVLSDEEIEELKAKAEEEKAAEESSNEAAANGESAQVSAPSNTADSFDTSACVNLVQAWADGAIPELGTPVFISGWVTGHTGGTIFLQPHQLVPDMFVYYDSLQYTPIDGPEITVYGIMGVEVVNGQYSMDGYVFTN